MATEQSLLFSWTNVDRLPDLQRLALVLEALPDEALLARLEEQRGHGRDDYPVRPMWRATVAGIVLQHESIESLIRELNRNPALLELCGFSPLDYQDKPKVKVDAAGKPRTTSPKPRSTVPGGHNFSRFLSSLVKLESQDPWSDAMVRQLREQLMAELPDFGEHLGYDGKAVDSHSTGQVSRKTGKTSDPDADWGKHETAGGKTGKLWRKVKSWFGFGLHVIADTRYEIPVDFSVTQASRAETKELDAMVDRLFEETPELAGRCKDFSADRGLDSGPIKAKLWDEHRIRPLIDTRLMWREEKKDPDYDPDKPIVRPLFDDNIYHTERGEVLCKCPETSVQRHMAFQGFEANRGACGTLKYRCPAAAFGFECAGRKECQRAAECQAGEYGRIVRVDLEKHDRRIFTPTPWGSPSWKRGYNRRSAMERIYSRVDNAYRMEKHYVRGMKQMRLRLGLVTVVMMAMALGHLRAERQDSMRSLVGPVGLPG